MPALIVMAAVGAVITPSLVHSGPGVTNSVVIQHGAWSVGGPPPPMYATQPSNATTASLQAQISVLQAAVNALYERDFHTQFNPNGPSNSASNSVTSSDSWEQPAR
jgi:hypothetical protein